MTVQEPCAWIIRSERDHSVATHWEHDHVTSYWVIFDDDVTLVVWLVSFLCDHGKVVSMQMNLNCVSKYVMGNTQLKPTG
jgi:hypothetical protein